MSRCCDTQVQVVCTAVGTAQRLINVPLVEVRR
jgi:hypothetical protein